MKFGVWSFVFFISACAITPSPTAAPPLNVTATPTSALNPGATLQPLPTTAPPAQRLRLWLPPQFAPSADTMGGKVLLAELSAFEEDHPGWQVEVRIKTVIGDGGLINSMRTTLLVAPNLGPDVIALDSPMLTEAAPVVQPLDARLAADDLADFYPFALQAARVNNQLDGLPFAADALGLAYSTTAYAVPPQTWIDLHDIGPLWLPLADPAALVTLQQYLALGGALTDTAGQPSIDESLLAEVLAHYEVM
ncbi:MAG: extracellular solute-binding protein, partial [Chloroflexota bacterium]